MQSTYMQKVTNETYKQLNETVKQMIDAVRLDLRLTVL